MKAEEKEQKLNEIYSNALSLPSDGVFLHQCLFDTDYLLRSKAFYVAERYADDAVFEAVYKILETEEREWQLRALSVLSHHPQVSALPILKKCLFQREKPLLIRGALFVLSRIGGKESLMLLAEFLCSPFSGYLKDDFLAECFAAALEKTENGAELWSILEHGFPELSAITSRLQCKVKDNELLMVYPYPDYLSRMAEKNGVSAGEWKRTSYFPRKKATGRKKG